MSDLPIVGAAMLVEHLDRHHNWLLDRQRDLELQDFCDPRLLEGDWRGRAEHAQQKLSGSPGRLGIHGAFYALPLNARDPQIRDVVKRRLWQGLDVCEVLGANVMVVHSPYSTWDFHNLDRMEGARAGMI